MAGTPKSSEPAFPLTEEGTSQGRAAQRAGLTKREYTAIHLLGAVLQNPLAARQSREEMVEITVKLADALLEALAPSPNPYPLAP